MTLGTKDSMPVGLRMNADEWPLIGVESQTR